MQNKVSQEYIKKFEQSEKIGLISTVTPKGQPHVTFINSLQANTPTQMIWGQCMEGMSKENIRNNPKVGFLIMSINRELWTGRAMWTHSKKEGPEYIMYNNKPVYRYNTYSGIHTVHYMDLIDISEESKINTLSVARGGIKTKIAKDGVKSKSNVKILNHWSEDFFNKLDTLKFISYIDQDGFPVIVPIIQAQASDSSRIVFSTDSYAKNLKDLQEGTPVSVFGLNLNMENVLVEGEFTGFQRGKGLKVGIVDIERVYNSMPPKSGYIYPKEKLKAITSF